jgi:ketosteroid isomerase-like protein
MTIQQDNIAATQQLFEAFGAGDIPGILEYVNDDIVIEFYGPSVIPYAGTYAGRDDARRFFETVLSSVEINQFEPQEMLADADKVVVTGHLNLKAISTGGVIDSDFVHVITLQDQKWSRFRDFMDTAVAQAAFTR